MKNASMEAREYALSTKGAAGTAETFRLKQNKVLDSLRTSASATNAAALDMKALSMAMSIGTTLAITKIIEGFIWIADKSIITLEEQKEEVENAASAYSNAQSQLENINSELKSQQQLIDDLQSKVHLTYVEKGQLKELKEATAELEMQKETAEKNTQNAQKDLTLKAINFLNRQFGTEPISEEKIQIAMFGSNTSLNLADKHDLNAQIAAYRLAQTLEEDKSKNEFANDISNNLISYQKILTEQLEYIRPYYNIIKDIPIDSLLLEDKYILDSYNRINASLNKLYMETSPEKWNTDQLSNILNRADIVISKEYLIGLAQASLLDENTIITQFPKLIEALREIELVVSDGETPLSMLLNEIYGLANQETSSLFSYLYNTDIGERLSYLTQQFKEGKLTHADYFQSLQQEIKTVDFSHYTDSLQEATALSQQFFMDSVRQVSSGLSDLIQQFSAEKISVSDYLDGYTSIAKTLKILSYSLEENNQAWKEHQESVESSSQLNSVQSSLSKSIQKINALKESCYSMSKIMSGTLSEDSEEFKTHIYIIAKKLAEIVASGGDMAKEVQQQLGTTTEEIAEKMTQNVSNQSLAAQTIATNTNSAIEDMALSVGKLFQTLGNAISDFKIELRFGVKNFTFKNILSMLQGKQDIPEIEFSLQPTNSSKSSLVSIGNTIAEFGNSLAENLKQQQITLEDFLIQPVTETTPTKTLPKKEAEKEASSSPNSSAAQAEKIAVNWKNVLDTYLTLFQTEFYAGFRDFQTYLSQSESLIKQYYQSGKISAQEYWNTMKTLYENQKTIYDKVLSSVSRRFDTEINQIQNTIQEIETQNNLLEKQKSHYDSALSGIQDFLSSQTDIHQKEIEAIETENLALQQQIDQYDALLNAVTEVFGEKREAIQSEVDLLQERIDKLQEANNEESKAIELEKAKYALERARNQRTQLVYENGQFVYKAKETEVQQAQETLANLKWEQSIAALETEKAQLQEQITQLDQTEAAWKKIADAFEKQKNLAVAESIFGENYQEILLQGDPTTIQTILQDYRDSQQKQEANQSRIDSIQETIKQLEQLSQKWNLVSSQHETAVNQKIAAELLGEDWKEQILSDSSDFYPTFLENYEKIQIQIEDHTALIETYKEKVTYYEKLKEEWSSLTQAYENAQNDQYAIMILGQDWESAILNGRLETLNQFRTQYLAIQKEIANAAWEAANAQVKASEEAQKASSSNTSSSQKQTGKKYQLYDTRTGLTLVSGFSSAQEAAKHIDSVAAEAQGAMFVGIRKYHDGLKEGYVGEKKTEDENLSLLKKIGNGLLKEKIPSILKQGKLTLTESQQADITAYLKNFSEHTATTLPLFALPQYNLPSAEDSSVSLAIGEINLHEVPNIDSFAHDVVMAFPTKVIQAIHQR